MRHARQDYNRIQDPHGLIPEDEPVMLFRGQDKFLPGVLNYYASAIEVDATADPEVAKKVRAWIEVVECWQDEVTRKSPDLPRAPENTQEILALWMPPNDADATTVREYLRGLLSKLWAEEESFSGKRPFGNSCWKYCVYTALALGGALGKTFEPGADGYDTSPKMNQDDRQLADKIIQECICAL